MYDIFKKTIQGEEVGTSKAGSFNITDLKVTAIHALLYGGAAALAILGDEVIRQLSAQDLGVYTALLVPVITSGVLAVKQWMTNHQGK